MASGSEVRVRGTFEKMFFLAAESLDAAGPVLAMDALDGFATKVGLDGLELSMSVVVRWSGHRQNAEKQARTSWIM